MGMGGDGGMRNSVGEGRTNQSNINRFFDALAFLESNNDPTEGTDSSASGAFQFMPGTRREAVEWGVGDPGDRSRSYDQQKESAIAYTNRLNPRAIAAIDSGDFSKAEQMLNGTWVALPGGSQPQSAERYAQYNNILQNGRTGGSSAGGSSAGGGPNSAQTAAFLESRAGDSDAAREAERQRKEAEREAEAARRAALEAAREARAAAQAVRSETNSANDMIRDSEISTSRNAEDNAIAAIEAANPTSDRVQEAAEKSNERLNIYRSASDEIEKNNRAARDLNQAISDEQSRASISEPVNQERIAQMQRQLAQLGSSNEMLREQRDIELDILNTKYKAATEAERQARAIERTAELTSVQRDNAELNLSISEAITDDPAEKIAIQREQALAGIEAKYGDRFEELRQDLLALTSDSNALTGLLEFDPSVAGMLEDVNARLAHTEELFKALAENKSLEEIFAGIDYDRSFENRSNEFTGGLTERNRAAEITLAGSDGNSVRRRQGTADINEERKNAFGQAQNLFMDGFLSADQLSASAIQIERIAAADLSELIEQTKTLGETFADSIDDKFIDAVTSIVDGTKTIGEAFSDMFANLAAELARMAVMEGFKQLFGGGQKSGGSNFGGGILQGIGSILGFANGGTVSSPTLAMIGEGAYNEAVVPLPDGRRIPVQLSGASGGQSGNQQVTITVNNNGSVDVFSDGEQAKELASMVKNMTQQQIGRATRADGVIGSQFHKRR